MNEQQPLRRIEIDRLGSAARRSPIRRASQSGQGIARFVPDDTWVRFNIEIGPGANEPELLFEKAGPRAMIYFDPAGVRAAIVTCGGLCPGLNNVIRSVFNELHFNYGVPEVLGIRYGYLGLNQSSGIEPIRLTSEIVADIHQQGGTFLGSSRGPQDVGIMVEFLAKKRIQLLFCVGGDGTQRGAHALSQEAKRRNLPLAVVGIPKTIDNDLSYCDRTFGVFSAVEKASEVIRLARSEARSTARGIGLVKLMGRDAGFVVCGAALASQEVDFALIPEQPFALGGSEGLIVAVDRHLAKHGHTVIAVAEGAGQHLFAAGVVERDASGNPRYQDIGVYLKQQLSSQFKQQGKPVDVKYIDPSYIIRSIPANCDDSMLCDQLARHAAHAALSGKTGLLIGYKNNAFIHIPIELAVAEKRRVNLEGALWAAVLAATGQPSSYAAT